MSNPNNDAHRLVVTQAEGVRQVAKAAAGNNQTAHKAADIAFYQAVLKSGRTNGISTGAYNALVNLGVDPGNAQAGDT
jgi:hypothetical protein